ncbi:hypothetical protein DXA13_20490 [Clostridium sp. AM58-1XD]|nr:hypothetical protein DXA13_20490 [Clostridium sp. AM58-1XD]
MQIMKMAPRALYEEYMKARKQPYMIHFAGYQKPWDVVDCDFAEYFWKYGKLSPYYEMLLRRIRRCFADELENRMPQTKVEWMGNDPMVRRIANRLLPFGSRRREAVKKVYKSLK